MKTEGQTIADIMDMTRKLSLYYLDKIEPEQLSEQPEMDGYRCNSPLWVMGHMAWAQASLVFTSTGVQAPDYPWLEQFAIGSEGGFESSWPTASEMRAALDAIHEKALERVSKLDGEFLDEPSTIPTFRTKRIVLYHCIRHEAQHIGLLSLFCRSRGIQIP